MGKREQLHQQRLANERRNKILTLVGITILALVVVILIISYQVNSIEKVVAIKPNPRPQADGMSMGNPDAPVKVDIYSDFQCPACKSLAENIEPALVERFVKIGQVYVTYHPFKVIGNESDLAAQGAYCAAEQDLFWEYHDILFANHTGENVGDFTIPRLKAYAKELELDTNAFDPCLDNGKYKEQVKADQSAGEAIRVSYTPSVFINGQLDTTGNYLQTVQSLLD